MEWLWVIGLLLPVFGPILWGIVRRRRMGSPRDGAVDVGRHVSEG